MNKKYLRKKEWKKLKEKLDHKKLCKELHKSMVWDMADQGDIL